ncbi:MAG: phosphatase PAP2 family protein [Chloroflexi bacterium]|nr:MAG: phosphatase PAP2 family protein [Chloroflexota bacterium]
MIYDTIVQILADGLVIPIILIGAASLLFLIPNNKKYEAYCRILMAGLTAYLIAKLLGTLYQPTSERPFQTLGMDPGASYLDNPGFPSDHALFAGAIALAVLAEVKRRWIGIGLVILTLLVCLGRVLALVHTPLDVIGGLLVSCVGAGWYLVGRSADNLPAPKGKILKV